MYTRFRLRRPRGVDKYGCLDCGLSLRSKRGHPHPHVVLWRDYKLEYPLTV